MGIDKIHVYPRRRRSRVCYMLAITACVNFRSDISVNKRYHDYPYMIIILCIQVSILIYGVCTIINRTRLLLGGHDAFGVKLPQKHIDKRPKCTHSHVHNIIIITFPSIYKESPSLASARTHTHTRVTYYISRRVYFDIVYTRFVVERHFSLILL